MERRVHGIPVRGVGIDPETRCEHYDGVNDVVAIRFPCCERYYACWECHESISDHEAEVWGRDSNDRLAILCGACGCQLPIARYLTDPTTCPKCEANFNPGCIDHHHRYFEPRD